MSLSLILGIVAVGALLTYFSFQIEREHFIFRLFLIFMVFILIIIAGQSALEKDCDIVLNSSTEMYIYGNNFTDYHWEYNNNPSASLNADAFLFHKNVTNTYVEFCGDQESGAANNFFLWSLWIFRLFVTYTILYLGYQSLEYLRDWWQRRKT